MFDHMYNYYPGSSATVQASIPSRIALDKKRIKYVSVNCCLTTKLCLPLLQELSHMISEWLSNIENGDT